jgi:glycosyltransferase involved in cell wall biosynthesis
VAEQGVSIEGWIIGDGDPAYRNELEELAGRLIPGRVKFWGHISNVRNVLQECDVLLHCSSREPFGLSIVEAMALELPVIAADVEGPREIITNGIDGLLVPPNDVDAYAAHLLRLSLDDDHRNSIAKKAHMTANERFRAIINIKQMERQMIASCQ